MSITRSVQHAGGFIAQKGDIFRLMAFSWLLV